MQQLFERLLKIQYPVMISLEVVKTALANGKITEEGYDNIVGEEVTTDDTTEQA